MTTILSLTDWFEVIRRGTSGDQVIDILYSWKAQSEKKDAEIEQLKVRLAASENDLVLIEVNEMLKKTQARVQELEQELKKNVEFYFDGEKNE